VQKKKREAMRGRERERERERERIHPTMNRRQRHDNSLKKDCNR